MTQRPARVGDPVLAPVGLHRLDALLPAFEIPQSAGPWPQLLDDVGGRFDLIGKDRLLDPLGRDLPGDLALAAGLVAGKLKALEL